MAIAGLSARIYLDHNANRQIAVDLRSTGYDAVYAEEVGLGRATDEVHLRFASEHGRVLFTHDLHDFPLIAAEWAETGQTHAGIILAIQTQEISYGALFERILALLNEVSAEEFVNLVRWA